MTWSKQILNLAWSKQILNLTWSKQTSLYIKIKNCLFLDKFWIDKYIANICHLNFAKIESESDLIIESIVHIISLFSKDFPKIFIYKLMEKG